MHIKVNDILNHSVGQETKFNIANEAVELEALDLSKGLDGMVSIVRLEDSLLVKAQVETAVSLECHRCLRAFQYPVRVSLSGEFSFKPTEEQWLIAKDYTIDLAPLVQQEIVLAIPLKQLCEPDCPGLCLDCGQRLDEHHKDHNKKEN